MKFNKIFTAFLAGALAFAGCNPAYEYVPASAPQGEQVFFPIEAATQVDLKPGQTSFELPIARATKSLEEIEIAIEASGEKIEFFSVPGAVTFAEDETETVLVVTIAQPDSLVVDVYYDLNIKVSDESLTTLYSRSSIALKVGLAMPWFELGKGTLCEIPYWGEEEPNKVIKYQQINDHMRLCKVEGCFGYDTIKNGGSYDVQDYVWYWDTETNDCFIFPFWMGYDNSNGHTMVSDYASYAFIKNDFESQAGFALGSDKYFAWAPGWARSNGLHVPHYDPVQGIFHLADVYSAWTSFEYSKDSILGYYTDSENGWDQFLIDGFVRTDFTTSVSYGGMFVDPKGECALILNFEGGDDVASVKYGLSATVEADGIFAAILAGEGEGVVLGEVALADGAASAHVAGLEPGLYNVVAVPCNAEGAPQADDAVAIKVKFSGLGSQEAVPQVGVYSYTDSDGTYTITLSVNPEDPEDYWIETPSGLPDGSVWHAAFDKETNTLVCEGIEVDYEEYENQFGFGVVYGWYNKANLYTYGYISFMENTSEDGSAPLVFDLDASGYLTGIENLMFGAYVYQSKEDGTPTKGLGWGYLLTNETEIDYEGTADATSKVQNFVEVRPVKEFSRPLTNVSVRLNKTANASKPVLSENIFTSCKLIQL